MASMVIYNAKVYLERNSFAQAILIGNFCVAGQQVLITTPFHAE